MSDNVWQFSVKFYSKLSKLSWKWNALSSSYGQEEIRFIKAAVFFAKIPETFWRQPGNIYEIILFKTDSSPQIFPLDL